MSQINELLPVASGKIGALAKTEKNKEQNFMFRSIDAIVAAAKPVFTELGISVTPRVLEKADQEVQAKSGARGWRCTVTMEYTFGAPDGSERVTSMAGEAIDYGDKATTKAEQMAYKYALTQVLLIGSGDADPDSESHELAQAPPAPQSPWEWLWGELKVFKAWSDKGRIDAVQLAVDSLAITSGQEMNRDEADRVFAHVQGQYESQGEAEALPLEEK